MTDSKRLNNLGVLIIQNIKLLQIFELKINMENMLFRRIVFYSMLSPRGLGGGGDECKDKTSRRKASQCLGCEVIISNKHVLSTYKTVRLRARHKTGREDTKMNKT